MKYLKYIALCSVLMPMLFLSCGPKNGTPPQPREIPEELIGIKETGLVEYLFQPDGFEVRHVRAAGQINLDLFSVLEPSTVV